jgi:hypothetical protein
MYGPPRFFVYEQSASVGFQDDADDGLRLQVTLIDMKVSRESVSAERPTCDDLRRSYVQLGKRLSEVPFREPQRMSGTNGHARAATKA